MAMATTMQRLNKVRFGHVQADMMWVHIPRVVASMVPVRVSTGTFDLASLSFHRQKDLPT